LPAVIGVVTSPSGAVIRDILHRLRDRFPRRVLIWPVAVQGQACAAEVAAAIRGFNALAPGGKVPRPDLIIVARGGGSLEDLWGFNEEAVVRAAAESKIPLISAVGHETDTTLIDFAADRRAPTPTAAAEMAVPVRAELATRLSEMQARISRATQTRMASRAQRLADLSRALGRPEAITRPRRQRFDLVADRLLPALRMVVVRKRAAFAPLEARISPKLLQTYLRVERDRLAGLSDRLLRAEQARLTRAQDRFARLAAMLQTLGYQETLRRGYAVVRGPADQVLTSAATAAGLAPLEIEFQDGRLRVLPSDAPPPAPAPKPAAKPRKAAKTPPDQGSLF
jgi:exodeoxyribonuclease VII large subunit